MPKVAGEKGPYKATDLRMCRVCKKDIVAGDLIYSAGGNHRHIGCDKKPPKPSKPPEEIGLPGHKGRVIRGTNSLG